MDDLIGSAVKTIKDLKVRRAELKGQIGEDPQDKELLRKRAGLLDLEIEELETAVWEMERC